MCLQKVASKVAGKPSKKSNQDSSEEDSSSSSSEEAVVKPEESSSDEEESGEDEKPKTTKVTIVCCAVIIRPVYVLLECLCLVLVYRVRISCSKLSPQNQLNVYFVALDENSEFSILAE